MYGGASGSGGAGAGAGVSVTGTPNKAAGVGGTPASDYSEGASHVLAVIHEMLAHHRGIEQHWTTKKMKLHQRLALR